MRLKIDHLRLGSGGCKKEKKMHFDERNLGDYRIYAGALEGPKGDGYIGMMVVQRMQGAPGTPREAYRDESLACGHRWETPDAALAYAISKAHEVIQKRPVMLAC